MNLTQNELILGALLVIAIVYIVFHHSTPHHVTGPVILSNKNKNKNKK